MLEKILICLSLLLLGICSCNNDRDLEKVWISKVWTQKMDSNDYSRMMKELANGEKQYSDDFFLHLDSMYNKVVDDKLIFKFNADSLTAYQFNSTKYHLGGSDFGYHRKGDSIVLKKDTQKIVSFEVEKLSAGQLILSNYDRDKHLEEDRYVFQPLKYFSPEITRSELDSFLTNNTFRIEPSGMEVLFHEADRFYGKISIVTPANIIEQSRTDNWRLDIVEGELFLTVGDEAIQIKAVHGNEIHGYVYGEQNQELILKRVDK